jgi:hypothetical protein
MLFGVFPAMDFNKKAMCIVTEFCEKGNLYDVLHDRDIAINLERIFSLAFVPFLMVSLMFSADCGWNDSFAWARSSDYS